MDGLGVAAGYFLLSMICDWHEFHPNGFDFAALGWLLFQSAMVGLIFGLVFRPVLAFALRNSPQARGKKQDLGKDS